MLLKRKGGLIFLSAYDKSGLVLRVETDINNTEEFAVRKHVLRNGKRHTECVSKPKGVAYLFRYREVSLQANGRYLGALAAVDDPMTCLLSSDQSRLETMATDDKRGNVIALNRGSEVTGPRSR